MGDMAQAMTVVTDQKRPAADSFWTTASREQFTQTCRNRQFRDLPTDRQRRKVDAVKAELEMSA